MKLLVKFSVLLILALLVMLVAMHLFIAVQGRHFLARKLEALFKRRVSISSLRTSFPATLTLRGLEVQGLAKIDELRASGGLLHLLRPDVRLSYVKIVRPVLTLQRNPSSEALPAQQPAAAGTPTSPSTKTAVPAPAPTPTSPSPAEEFSSFFSQFSAKRLVITDGMLQLTDRAAGTQEIVLTVKHIALKVSNLDFTGRSREATTFSCAGRIPWREGSDEGVIDISGWLNLSKKDIDATIRISDIDAMYLAPYYSSWLDLDKARIQRAKLQFTSVLKGSNNNVTANCHLELTDLVFRSRPADTEAPKEEKMASTVVGMFKGLDKDRRIVLNFKFKTKLTQPQFGIEHIVHAVEARYRQAHIKKTWGVDYLFIVPGKIVEGVITGVTEVSRTLVDGIRGVARPSPSGVVQN